MPLLPFTWVDVFAAEPFGGNQLAVFTAPPDLPVPVMQRIARELNHSETTFLQPPTLPGADCRVRIFIPTLPLAAEVPFAGHPILGTACVAAGGAGGTVRLETGVGILPVTVTPLGAGRWEAGAPQPLPRLVTTMPDALRAALAGALGLGPHDLRADLPVEAVDNGMQTVIIPLAAVAAVQQARPDLARLRDLLGRAGLCVLVFALSGEEGGTGVRCRVFSPFDLVPEDPATGSANGPLGEYLVRHGAVPGADLSSRQGDEVGRPGRLHIRVERDGGVTRSVRVAGEVHLIGEGSFRISL